MGDEVRGPRPPKELEQDPVDAVWSVTKKTGNMARMLVPSLMAISNKVAASASATNALFAVGAANILILYVNIWIALGGAYAAAREDTRIKATIMGFSTGFGARLAGTYDYNDLAWFYISTKGRKFERELHELQKNAFNSGLIRGASEAAYLKVAHRNIIAKQLDQAVDGRYPASFSKADRYGAYINHAFRKHFDI